MSLENKGAVRLIDVEGDPVNVSDAGNLMVDIGALTVTLDDINIGNVVLQNDAGTDLYSGVATSDSNPDLDGELLLGTHALLSARTDANTTVGITALDSTHKAVHVALSSGDKYAIAVDGSTQVASPAVVNLGAE